MKRNKNIYFKTLIICLGIIFALHCGGNKGSLGQNDAQDGNAQTDDATAPAEVSNLQGAIGDSKVTLTWLEPSDTDFAKVVITYTPDTTTAIEVLKGTTVKEITGLTNGTNYTFTIKAVDNTGNNSVGVQISKTPNATPLWSQQAYLKAANAETVDYFGYSVSISADTIVVGAYGEDSNQTTITNGATASGNNSAATSGAAYVFVRSGSNWSQQAYLKAPNAEGDDQFGTSVSVSGDTLVVGARYEDSNQTTITNGITASSDNSASGSGAAYVFVRNGSNWSQQAYLKAPNAGNSDNFGCSVSVSGDTLVVGAEGEDSNQTTITNGITASSDNSAAYAGAAYVFVRSGSNWSQQAYLKAPDVQATGPFGDNFGYSVSVSGDTIVVGAYGEDSNQTTITNGATASSDNSAPNAGAAYVFVRSGSNWSQQAYLKAPDVQATGLFGENFGYSVSVSGDTIVVGAYNEDSNQTTITNGATASSDNSASESGAAYVFVRSGSNWSQQAYLKAPNAGAGDYFGYSVSVSGDTIVVGAVDEDSNQTTITNGATASSNNSASNAGAAYVFVRSGSNWSQQAYLKAANANSDDLFGYAVSVSGDTIVVGASGEGSNQTTITNGATASSDISAPSAGAAYVFVRQ